MSSMKRVLYGVMAFILLFTMIPGLGSGNVSFAAALPDGTQTFTGYSFSGETGTSPDGFFALTASKSVLKADEYGAYIQGSTDAETVNFQIDVIGDLNNFILESVYVGEYADGVFNDVTIVGYLDEVEVFSTTPYSTGPTGTKTDNFPIDYSPAANNPIDRFRVYYTKTGDGTDDADFNLLNFTIGEASDTPPVPTYTVTYNGNTNTGGSVPTDNNTYTNGTTVTVLENTGSLEKTGYTFDGWNTAADGSGTDYAADATFDIGAANVNLYAQWTAVDYTVTYDGNSNTGGTVPTDGSTYNINDSVTVLGNTGSLTRIGYTFAGWNTAADGSGTDYAAGATLTMGSSNVTLYAQWSAVDYTVTYDGNTNDSGSVPTDGNTYNITNNVTVLGNTGSLAKTGYSFDGWNTAADGSGTSYAASDIFAMGSSNVTLYAQWSPDGYTVTYNGNGNESGSVPTDGTIYNISDSVTVLDNTGTLAKAGYTFAGWNTAADGSGTDYAADATLTMGSSNVTLYAQWTAVDYTVTYNGNGNDSGAVPTDGNAYNITNDVTVLGNTGSLAKTGYTFGGWNTAADGSGTDYAADATFAMGSSNVTLYAQWTAIDYSITYNGNGNDSGTVPTDGNTYNIADDVTILGNTGSLAKTGYTFDGWNTAADGSGTDYAADATLTMGSSSVTLYAQWTAVDYTVTYDGNSSDGGAVPTDGNTYNITDEATVLGNTGSLSKTGYTFAGWNTSADGSGTDYAASSSLTIGSSSVTLYAQWTAVDYTVTYDGNNSDGGTVPVDGNTYNITDSVTVLDNTGNLTRTGYTFAGWNTAADGSGTDYAADATFAMGSSNVTLYAQWTAIDYSITYNGNGNDSGTVPTDGNTYNIADDVTILGNTGSLAKTGYTFDGWNTAADGSGTGYAASSTLTMGSSSVTLYAQWTAVDYTVTYDGNGSDGGAVPTDGNAYNITDEATVLGNTGSLSKTGYTFAGWNTSADGSGMDYAASSSLTIGSTSVTLYAQWTAIDYSITYNGNGNESGTVPTDGNAYNITNDVTVLGNTGSLAKTGYTFAGWNTAADRSGTDYAASSTLTMGSSNVTLYAQWTAIDYSITYNGNGNDSGAVPTDGNTYNITNDVTILGNTGSLAKSGYTFDGWNTAADGSGTGYEADATLTMGSSSVTLYAQWTAVDYTVTYDGNSSDGGAVPTDGNTYNITDEATVLGNTGSLSKTGYTFAGWNTSADGSGMDYAASSSLTIGSTSVTLYAQWTAIDYSITYNGNGNESGTVPTDGNAYNITNDVTVLGNTGSLAKTGYTFAGWNTMADGSGTDYTASSTLTMGSANVTLYAQWNANEYAVTYDGNGNESGSAPSDGNAYNITNTVTVLGNTGSLAKSGYTFAGWNTAADGSGTDYATSSTLTMGSSNVTLYAQWTAIDYTVTYDGNGSDSGAVPTDGNAYNITDSVTVLDNTGSLTKTGYTFGGWNTATDGSGTDYAAGASFIMGSADVTLYAQWMLQPYTVSFDSNGGSVVSDQEEEYDSLISEPAEPTRTGYTFADWYADEALTTQWDFASDKVPASDMTLYAKWTINSYDVTYSTGGGSSVSGESVPYLSLVTEPNTPVKTGYTFGGWYSDDNLTTQWDFETDTMPASNMTLYAKWTVNTYTVSFSGNGGSDTSSQDILYGEVVEKPNDPIRSGYTFGGWFANDALTTGWNFTTDTVPASDITLYAKWNMIIDTNLSGLAVDGYTLEEIFAPETTYYTVNGVIEEQVDVQAVVTAEQFSTVTVNGNAVSEEGWRSVSLSNGANTIDIVVTAQDGTTQQTYTLVINKLSDVALLKTLAVDDLELVPSFQNTHTSYQVHVVSSAAIEVELEPEDDDANIYYDGEVVSGGAITLSVDKGLNTFAFKVVADNGVDSNTYTLTADRDNDDPRPSDIAVRDYALTPGYDPDTTTYDVSVIESSVELTVTIAEYDDIQINGQSVGSGEGYDVPLAVGENEIEIEVTAENGLVEKTYQLTVYRKNNNPDLDDLSIEDHSFTEDFKPGTLTYDVSIYEETEAVITAEIEDASALTINGNDVEANKGYTVQLTPGYNTFDVRVTAEDGVSQKTYTITVYKANNVARLSNLTTSANGIRPAFDPEVTTYVLGNTYSGSVRITPEIAPADKARLAVDGTWITSGQEQQIGLTTGKNKIEIAVLAEDRVTETTYVLYIEKKKREVVEPTQPVEEEPEDEGTIVLVNGKEEKAGEEDVTEEAGKVVSEVKVNKEVVQNMMKEALEEQDSEENTVAIVLKRQEADVVKAKLTGDIVKNMEDDDFTVLVQTDDVEYNIPAKEINISKVAGLLEVEEEALEDIEVFVEIEHIDEVTTETIVNKAKESDYEVVFPPVEFKVTAKARRKDGQEHEVEVSTFTDYVERAVEIPDNIDPEKVTTGVLYNADGTFSHVPTKVVERNGSYYAEINSLTNSSYSVIWNPVEMDGMDDHWAKGAVNNLASRLIIANVNHFDADCEITRGEFIDYIVKGLGLHKSGIGDAFLFKDLPNSYTDTITAAVNYGIVTGYPDGTIRTDAYLTREEAMVILKNALTIVKMKAVDDSKLSQFDDSEEVSKWAREAATMITGTEIMVGVGDNRLDPKGTLTCAQAAQIVENMLIAGELIND